MKRIASMTLSVAFLAASLSFGKDAPKANPFSQALTSVPAAELPAKAADLVLHARPADREATTLNVVKGAVGLNPAAAPAVGPPYIPLTTPPTNVTSGTSGQVPTGGRNYAAP